MYHVDPHAALRWAQRIMGHPEDHPVPTEVQRRAERAVYTAMETAVCTARSKRSKTRHFVTGDGTHLVVLRGGIVKTVYPPGWIARGCTCGLCVRHRAQQLKAVTP